jgi:hypothetical protein
VKTALGERRYQDAEDIKKKVTAELTAVSLGAIDDYLNYF